MLVGEFRVHHDAAVVEVAEVGGKHHPHRQLEVQLGPTRRPGERHLQPGPDFDQVVQIRHVLAGIVVVGIGRERAVEADVELDAFGAQDPPADDASLAGPQEVAAIDQVGQGEPVEMVLRGGRVVRHEAAAAGDADLP